MRILNAALSLCGMILILFATSSRADSPQSPNALSTNELTNQYFRIRCAQSNWPKSVEKATIVVVDLDEDRQMAMATIDISSTDDDAVSVVMAAQLIGEAENLKAPINCAMVFVNAPNGAAGSVVIPLMEAAMLDGADSTTRGTLDTMMRSLDWSQMAEFERWQKAFPTVALKGLERDLVLAKYLTQKSEGRKKAIIPIPEDGESR
jgi:hypothetical protein